MKKIYLCLCIIFCIVIICPNCSLATQKTSGVTITQVQKIPEIHTKIDIDRGMWGLIETISGVVAYICYAAAFIVILIQGVKFMIAAPDAQAEIKKQSVAIVVGASIVFGIGVIIQIIVGFVSSLF